MRGRAAALWVSVVVLAAPLGAASKKECRDTCGALIDACAQYGTTAGYGDLAKACRKAVLKRCRREGTGVCGAFCGDGAPGPGEACDGGDVRGLTCATLGFRTGTLACAPGCGLDTSACVPFVCGDGVAEGLEACDGADLRGETCKTLNPAVPGGTLACTATCTLDPTGCTTQPYVDNGNGTVTDRRSGLTWEKKVSSLGCIAGSIHCVGDTYTFTDALADFVPRLNDLNFAGADDWRLPTLEELYAITSEPCPPCIDTVFGPTAAAGYWTREYCSGTTVNALGVDFSNRFTTCSNKTGLQRVRAVRGP